MVAGRAGRGADRALAPLRGRAGPARRGRRPLARDPRHSGRLAGRHRRRLRYRGDRDRDVVAPGCARRRHAGLGEFRRGLGRRCRAAQARRCPGTEGALWPAPGFERGRSGSRRRLHLERHDLRCPGAERRLDRRRPQGARDLRCDLGGLCDAAALGQARRRHLVVAEIAGRRGGARHAGALAARRRTARELHPALALAKAVPADFEGEADRRGLPRRDDQHAVDAVRRGRARTR